MLSTSIIVLFNMIMLVPTKVMFSLCFQHYTPLHAAAAGGQLSTLKQLLRQGASVRHLIAL